ncbi:S-layer homology domain-containing protein [Planktothrix sp. FACHB-1355]|uniref:S-layer homology domain-containing protein n=1 Tax=Planktothrix sp. FACHB-1355 TaxID=2692854 RepID=UPI00168A43AB|nr:S-layer homology domain-containing protein [Planktothrix sp. FACHB-1355]MBD3560906.1 S-layer homology domain-containing protein [Planktothrix sp. FACHB-1355]
MNKNFLAVLGKIVFAATSLGIWASAEVAIAYAASASTSPTNPAVAAQVLAEQPARREPARRREATPTREPARRREATPTREPARRREAVQNNFDLPEVITNGVLENLSQQTGMEISALRIVAAQQETWPDGCLGIASPGIVCSKALVPGWRVVVGSDRQSWVYRTNLTGSLIKLDPTASENVAATPPPPLPRASQPTRLPAPPSRRQTTASASGQSGEPLPPVELSQSEIPQSEGSTLIEEPAAALADANRSVQRRNEATPPRPQPPSRLEEPTPPRPQPPSRPEEPTPPRPQPVSRPPQQTTAIATPPRRTAPPPPRQNGTENRSGFSLMIRQPLETLPNPIARVSLKSKNGNNYAPERLIGDYRYRLDRRAQFRGGMNAGDRIVVRLYDNENRSIGYSEFELLSENAAVNLILPERPLLYRMVRTLYGIDADRDGNMDEGTSFYDYYTILTGTRPGEERVTFLNGVPNTSLTWFQVAGLPLPSRTSAYPASFGSGEYAVTNQAISIFRSDMPRVLTAAPGKESRITNVSNNSTYQVTRNSVSSRSPQDPPAPPPQLQVSFADVPSNHWARGFIAELARQEILQGFPDGLYRPNAPVTRAELASILRKAFDRNKIRDVVAFKDVPTNHWAYPAIREAYEMGFLETNSTQGFSPDQKVSRLDVLVALGRGLKYSAGGSVDSVLRVYRDASSIPRSDRDIIAAVTQRDMVVSYPNVNYLYPGRLATRAEVAALIYRALVSIGKAEEIVSPYVVVAESTPNNTQVREGSRSDRQRTNTRDRR